MSNLIRLARELQAARERHSQLSQETSVLGGICTRLEVQLCEKLEMPSRCIGAPDFIRAYRAIIKVADELDEQANFEDKIGRQK